MQINYCGMSGGKDSTATALWLIHESGVPLDTLRFTACNTHNEDRATYDYIDMLSDRFEAWSAPRIIWLEPERGFFELAKWKQRFPSRKARFCTQFLKVIPTRKDIEALQMAGHEVTLYSGTRRDESTEREALEPESFDLGFGCKVIRPFLNETREDVFAYAERFGIKRNPLYDLGAWRVGCFPCINSRKEEIRAIAEHRPERIGELREWEGELGSSFFARKTTPERFRSRTVFSEKQQKSFNVPTIDDVVAWSKTDRGGSQYPLRFDDGLVCNSGVGMCE